MSVVATDGLPPRRALSWAARMAARCETRPIFCLTVLLALALAVRLPLLYDRDAWLDELDEYFRAAGGSLVELPDRVRSTDRFPPGMAYLGRAVTSCGGGVYELRLISLFAGLGCVPLAWLFGRWSFEPAVGWLVALLTALTPAYVFYSREGRPFALGLLALHLFLVALAGLVRTPSYRWTIFGVVAAWAVSVTQYATIAVAGIAVGMALLTVARTPHRSSRSVGMLGTVAVAVLAFGGWVYWAYAAPQIAVRGTGAGQFAGLFYDIRDGLPAGKIVLQRTIDLMQYAAIGGAIGPRWGWLSAAAVAVGLVGLRGVRGPQEWWVVGSVLATFVVFAGLAGVGKHPYGGTRHCLVLVPLLWACVAAGVVRAGGLCGLVAGLGYLLLVGLMTFGTVRVIPHENSYQLSDVLPELRDRLGPGEAVLLTGTYDSAAFGYQATGNPLEGMRVFSDCWEQGLRPVSVPGFPAPVFAANLRELPTPGAGTGRRLAVAPPVGGAFWVLDTYRSEAPPEPQQDAKSFEVNDVLHAAGVRATRWRAK
ncbi:glycosyltransferase family 39 protein [Limnoglobus roseus]|uniref:Glycosyltransferase RgtA/B/C/D-like domain-containing protein n=1 Tax=Limnoglobus roseus TaxID=2598579 RepID=A0A5C1A8K6_9BACT|nr:glycosyltransferase family 39 protein [Limnoglobus roseus]QEL15561.1 hypothetical protein PX52LOC_02486 [Limnoglobus roseus]